MGMKTVFMNEKAEVGGSTRNLLVRVWAGQSQNIDIYQPKITALTPDFFFFFFLFVRWKLQSPR